MNREVKIIFLIKWFDSAEVKFNFAGYCTWFKVWSECKIGNRFHEFCPQPIICRGWAHYVAGGHLLFFLPNALITVTTTTTTTATNTTTTLRLRHLTPPLSPSLHSSAALWPIVVITLPSYLFALYSAPYSSAKVALFVIVNLGISLTLSHNIRPGP